MVMSRKTRSSSSSRSNQAKLAQLGMAVPQVMAHRLTRMAMAGPLLSPRDRKEFTGMVMEKQLAFSQAWMAMAMETWRMQQAWAAAWFTGQVPSLTAAVNRIAAKGLAPVHRKAVSNAKRLAKTRI
ncbi:hypothetical protein [Hydrogenophaga sp. 5NK40-0174]|uniref:hypothetical protein n=1 Tax=Hydrogenophaga sp. 5NK40-0174 TaxID=3127649 RepID=UPI0031033C49